MSMFAGARVVVIIVMQNMRVRLCEGRSFKRRNALNVKLVM